MNPLMIAQEHIFMKNCFYFKNILVRRVVALFYIFIKLFNFYLIEENGFHICLRIQCNPLLFWLNYMKKKIQAHTYM